jgi:hypothetical protein
MSNDEGVYLGKCSRCQKEIVGAKDYGRLARKNDNSFGDICIDCDVKLNEMVRRHQQELDEYWDYKPDI